MRNDQWHMQTALIQAQKAYSLDEVPVGAVLVDESGKVIAEAYNLKEKNCDPCGHAEIICIRQAAEKLKAWRLENCTLYVTLEPCPMCLGAMVHARIKRLVFGAYDAKGGAISLGYRLFQDERLNHRFEVMGGVEHYPCSQLLSQYFREKRANYRQINKF